MGIPTAILLGILPNILEMSGLFLNTILMLFIATMTYQTGLNKEFGKILKGRKIEMDVDEIRIKSNRGILEEKITIGPNTSIKVKESYNFSEETAKDVYHEMRGQPRKNFLIVDQESISRILDFTIDSFYIIEQLKKVIA